MNKILYLPVVRRKFDAKTAETIRGQLSELLSAYDVIEPTEALGDPTELASFLSQVQEQDFAGIIFHNTTFTDAEFVKLVHRYYPEKPILLLAPREPSVHGWLHFNSLTGIVSSANYLHTQKHYFQHIYGNPDEIFVQKKIQGFVKACLLKDKIANSKIGVVGTFPPGFFFSDADAVKLKATFGITLKHYEIDEAFIAADALQEAIYKKELDYAAEHYQNLDINGKETIKFVKFVALMKQWAKRDGFSALASRCWPDFFDKYGCAPGAVWTQLDNEQLPTAMECDIHGALSMYILQELTPNKAATYLGDLSSLDEEDNTITMWHDYGAYDVANPKYGIKAGVHPNRKMPVSPDAVLKPGKVTVMRVHYDTDGYKLVAFKGRALDVEPQYNGFSGKIQLKQPVDKVVDNFIESGYESHFALVYGDYVEDIANLAKLLNIKCEIVD
ncbi:hypothetical protein LB941_05795 [Ligilactobacillus sp. WILCCON 0076]|uniref:L-fucose isomerase C-terminal domain-containing protein n=1 Tax=Ligilactobacillus ubinensis TaxID=2876789 RepID=A0A9X2FLC8_9LACO|nr:hypothetical protein [Ligilactobacillus ubinensis]MCP0886851.1 hypothetical protein [Ligilactobacillus ubinensis]